MSGLIKNADQVYVMGHKNSDLDSFGASLGVAKLAQGYGKNAKIVIDFDSIEQKTKDVALFVKSDVAVSYTHLFNDSTTSFICCR